MGQLEQVSTFNGEQFSALSIPGKREEGLNPSRTLWINLDKNMVVVVSAKGDVIASISSDNGQALVIENL